MKTLWGKKLAGSVSSVGSMILFLMFAAFSLVMISVGAATYSRISDSYRDSFSSTAAVRYVTNKIRGGERAVVENNGNGIAVYSGEMVCVIMTDNDNIGERNARASSYVDYAGGDVIFPGTELAIGEHDGVFEIVAISGDDICVGYCKCKG